MTPTVLERPAMRALPRLLGAAAVLLALGCSEGQGASAQIIPTTLPEKPTVERTIISSTPSCADCRLTLERVVRLGGPQGLGGTMRMVRTDSRGFYYVVDKMKAARQVFVFDSTGRFVRSIGGPGQGPGEYRFISQMFVLPGDSLRLHDLANARYTIIGPDHEFVRTVPFPPVAYGSALLLPDGRMITNQSRVGAISGKDTQGKVNLPVSVMDANGAHLRSFGLEQADSTAGNKLEGRSLTLAPDGRLYVGHSMAYVVEAWDTLGVKHREFVRDADWFRPWKVQPKLSTREPRHPHLGPQHVDEEGRLWTMVPVMQPGWERHLEPAPERDGQPSGGVILGGVTRNDTYDTIVEVIDLKTGRLIVSQRFDVAIYDFLGDGRVVTDGEDATLNSYVDIWRLTLVGPS